jgi:metal-responsive CopG/Arc/MetJ family transcriptional regulator
MENQQQKTQERRGVVTSIALPGAMLSALDREAERIQVYSRSAVIRQAVQEYLAVREDDQQSAERKASI